MNESPQLPPADAFPRRRGSPADDYAPQGRQSKKNMDRAKTVRRLSRRLYPWRLAWITAMAAIAGGLLTVVVTPHLSADIVASLLRDHLPSAESTPLHDWFGLCMITALPLCLLSLAGLTYFSGTVTLTVIGYRAMAEGAVLALLWQLRQGRLSCPSDMDANRLLWAYGLWIASAWVLRGVIALRSRRTADGLVARPTEDAAPSVLPVHAAVTLAVLLLHMAMGGLYTFWLYSI